MRRLLYRVGRWLVHRYDPSRPRIKELNRQLAAKRAAGEESVLMVKGYVLGESGWALDANGNVEFNDVRWR